MEQLNKDEILDKINFMSSVSKLQMWGAAQEYWKEIDKAAVAENAYKTKYNSVSATKIKDNMFIVEVTDRRRNEIYFQPYVNGRCNYIYTTTFNEAVLAAISIEQTGDTEAGRWAGKLMGMNGD